MFKLDHRLDNDSEFIADWGDFSIRLIKDERFFWLLIIPRLTGVTEWHELPDKHATTLTKLISYLSKQIKLIDKADKINVAALGNIVNQFHLHLIARHSGDAAWPGPVWGTGQAVPLLADTRDFRTQAVRKLLADFSS
jgi:diadenosine tetraphosphate (Ap4A) HIT family hydrolase